MNRQNARLHLMAYGLMLLAVAGCSGAAERGQVTGRVTWKGAPVALATVTFQPTHGVPSYGITDDDGRYELRESGGLPGAVIAIHSVTVETYRIERGPDGELKEHPETIPAEYNTRTTLTREIKAGQQSIDFTLPRN